MVAGETALAGGALFCADAFHLEASADSACPGQCEWAQQERGRKDLEPRVGFGLDSSSSVRGFFVGSVVRGDEGRLWATGGVPSESEPWEEGDEQASRRA